MQVYNSGEPFTSRCRNYTHERMPRYALYIQTYRLEANQRSLTGAPSSSTSSSPHFGHTTGLSFARISSAHVLQNRSPQHNCTGSSRSWLHSMQVKRSNASWSWKLAIDNTLCLDIVGYSHVEPIAPVGIKVLSLLA